MQATPNIVEWLKTLYLLLRIKLHLTNIYTRMKKELLQKMVDETAKILAKGLSLVACVVNPQVFVIGGGMSKAGDFLITKVQEYYQEFAFHACKNTFFKLADLGNDAGIYGCVRMIIK